MMSELDRIRERLEAATPGPWVPCGARGGDCICGLVWMPDGETVLARTSPQKNDTEAGVNRTEARVAADAWFIAHAPADVRALLRVVDACERVRRVGVALPSSVQDELDALTTQGED